MRYLFRRAVPDSGGPGKFRGGVCHEYAFTPNGTRGPMGLVLFGKGTRAPMSLGIFGGYRGCNVGYTTFRDANVDELPDRLEALRGAERVNQFWGQLELADGDVQYVRFMGGGGYGDALDRDPELVLRDVLAGLVTEEPARDVYGVVDGDDVDAEATRARRRELREARLGRPDEARRARRRSAHRPPTVRVPATHGGGIDAVHMVRCRDRARWSRLEGARRPAPDPGRGSRATSHRLGRVLPDRGLLPGLRHAARCGAHGRR